MIVTNSESCGPVIKLYSTLHFDEKYLPKGYGKEKMRGEIFSNYSIYY